MEQEPIELDTPANLLPVEIGMWCNWNNFWDENQGITNIHTLAKLNAVESGEPICEHCNKYHKAITEAPVRTMYASGNDPHPFLCPDCMEEWNELWDARWAEYYSGLL